MQCSEIRKARVTRPDTVSSKLKVVVAAVMGADVAAAARVLGAVRAKGLYRRDCEVLRQSRGLQCFTAQQCIWAQWRNAQIGATCICTRPLHRKQLCASECVLHDLRNRASNSAVCCLVPESV